jgi:Arc/MetJ-type ribon-helix-helix transcriptional regulator
MTRKTKTSLPDDLTAEIVRQLSAQGVDLEKLLAGESLGERAVKVVCLPADLRGSLVELLQAPRDQVLMVRVDKESIDLLDAWVETGAARSRSEAVALFLKEGLKVRASELRELSEALAQVQEARRVLREKATKVLGRAEPAADGEER